MKLNFWPFNKPKRRHSRWVLDVSTVPVKASHKDVIMLLQLHTPILSAGQYNKLSPELRSLFVRVGGK